MKKIMVIGSISMDFVVKTKQVPAEGETLIGESFNTYYGGKGANQGVAASRLGGQVSMIGAVGKDVFGQEVLTNLQKNHINTDGIKEVSEISTGVAHIIVKDGDNRIIVVPGTNDCLKINDIEQRQEAILASDVVILQNETPAEVIDYVINYCYQNNVATVLNPAPAREMLASTIAKATYLTPNETEFGLLFPELPLEEALEQYANKLIVTLGSQGAAFHDGQQLQMVPAFKVKPVDTTGAGDTFNGGLAVGIANHLSLKDSVTFGNLASSLAVQANGAQAGIPTLAQMKGEQAYDEAWHIE